LISKEGGQKHMTKSPNKGSQNQNSPRSGGKGFVSGDNSKGNRHNKDQNDKTDTD
jgi:hypothetical protein